MRTTLPKRLRKEPLLEAVWEIRFSSDVESVVELLPGLIYKELAGTFTKITRLPAANLPGSFLQQDASLKYVPTVRLDGDQPYSIQIGEHVVSLSCPRPYTGWIEFGKKIRELAQMLRATKLLTRPERFSLKYIDIVSGDGTPSIAPLAVDLKLGGHDLAHEPVHLRTEIREEEQFLHIVQIGSPTQATLPTGDTYNGVLLDIDTISPAHDQDFWSSFDNRLDLAHELSKKLFFRLLTEETIKSLEPEY